MPFMSDFGVPGAMAKIAKGMRPDVTNCVHHLPTAADCWSSNARGHESDRGLFWQLGAGFVPIEIWCGHRVAWRHESLSNWQRIVF